MLADVCGCVVMYVFERTELVGCFTFINVLCLMVLCVHLHQIFVGWTAFTEKNKIPSLFVWVGSINFNRLKLLCNYCFYSVPAHSKYVCFFIAFHTYTHMDAPFNIHKSLWNNYHNKIMHAFTNAQWNVFIFFLVVGISKEYCFGTCL